MRRFIIKTAAPYKQRMKTDFALILLNTLKKGKIYEYSFPDLSIICIHW